VGRIGGGGWAAEKARSPQVRRLVLMVFSVCAGGPEATRWSVEGEESEREGGARLFRAL